MLLTPSEIIEKHPEVKKFWNKQQIGWLLSLGLVSGKKLSRGSIIEDQDVLNVLDFKKQKER